MGNLSGIGGRRQRTEELKRMASLVNMMAGRKVKGPRKERSDKGGTHDSPEARLRVEVVKLFKRRRVYYKRFESALAGKHAKGIPDFLIMWRNQFIWIELKIKGVWYPEQREFADHCLKCGVRYEIIRSTEQMEGVLDEMG